MFQLAEGSIFVTVLIIANMNKFYGDAKIEWEDAKKMTSRESFWVFQNKSLKKYHADSLYTSLFQRIEWSEIINFPNKKIENKITLSDYLSK